MDEYKIKYSGKPINKKVDYIRREDVYSLFENMNYIIRDEKYGDCFKKIERCIAQLPAADVEYFIHCKDCKYNSGCDCDRKKDGSLLICDC